MSTISSVKYPVAKTTADTTVTAGQCLLSGMLLLATATAAAATLQDESGHTLIQLGQPASGMTDRVIFSKPIQIGGYKLSSLTNGNVLIYLL